MFPEGWMRRSLGSIATLERGRFSARPRNDPRYFGGDIPFVQTGDVANAGRNLTSYSQTLNSEGLVVSKVFPKDTILITIAANIGATAITAFAVACPDSLVGIRVRPHLADTAWLKYALDACQASLDEQAGQNAQKNINLQVLEPFELLVPPLAEQKRVGAILTTWDAAITTTEKLLANSRRQKKALTQALLFDSNMHWEKFPLSAISERIQRTSDGAQYPVLMISSGVGFVRQDQKYSRFMAGKSLNDYILLKRGEFAYNKGNSKLYEFGCVFPLEDYPQGLVPHVYVCFKLGDRCHPGFFKYLFEADYLHDQLGAMVNTGVRNNGLLNIRPSDFMSVNVPLPPMERQRYIADVLAFASREIELLQADLDALRSQKRAVMADLLTGKRRVRLPEAATEEQVAA